MCLSVCVCACVRVRARVFWHIQGIGLFLSISSQPPRDHRAIFFLIPGGLSPQQPPLTPSSSCPQRD